MLRLTFLLLTFTQAEAIKCQTGSVSYCGIGADQGPARPPGAQYYDPGANFACSQEASNMDPTTIAPNCWDADSCNALQTSGFDDPFTVSHQTPYTYVSDAQYGYSNNGLEGGGDLTDSQQQFESAFNISGTCPSNHPACGLQTTIAYAPQDCAGCYTRFRYSLDLGAFYFRTISIDKRCLSPADDPCAPTACYCVTTPPYYSGNCSHWARGVCRRKLYTCVNYPSDFIWKNVSDYDILFCSIGTDDPLCDGCVACMNSSCLQPTIHASFLFSGADLTNPASYNCSARCGEMPRTCFNETCYDSDDCWPRCDPTIYERRNEVASMGFYVKNNADPDLNMVEQVVCCSDSDYCNYANSHAPPPALPHLAAAAAAALFVLAFTSLPPA